MTSNKNLYATTRKAILILHRSAVLRHAIGHYADNLGFASKSVQDGAEAINLLRSEKFDMLIMDVELEGQNGFEVIAEIRLSMHNRWIPIIVCTGLADEEDLKRAIDEGADDYLMLPVSETILAAKIKVMERIINMREELAEKSRELSLLAERDSLTALYNRRAFLERASAVEPKDRETSYVVMLDIDHFKLFNDEYGHPAGDECIRMVADVLAEIFGKQGGLVARYGGEEFVAYFRAWHPSCAEERIESIRSRVESLKIKHQNSPTSSYVTVSIGCCRWAKSEEGIDVAIKNADECLYKAKQTGRNRWYM